MSDLVSREALYRAWDALDETQDPNLLIDAMIRETQHVSGVDAEPVRHGKWVWCNDAIDWGIGAWVCSECGVRNENIHAEAPGKRRGGICSPYVWAGSQYCPNCGAKMYAEVNHENGG